jgi:putative PIG3 family NAD(P)H quinone oxidoreductase
MKAIISEFSGGPEVLKIKEVPQPVPKRDELLVQVKAAGINRADILQRIGKYPVPAGASEILGLEIAGIVIKKGRDCASWKTGQKIFGLLGGGGYAEFAVIHQEMALPMPDCLSFEEAAAIPEAFLTAYQSIVWIGKLKPDETILIHAGASGVGTAAIQLAREIGANIIATAGSDEKIAYCMGLGAKHAINYKSSNFAEEARKVSGGKGVNLILDFVGKAHWDQNMAVLASDGRLVILATMSGSLIPNFDLKILMKKRLTLNGSTLRNRDLSYKIKLTQEFREFALHRLSKNQLSAVVDRVFPWEKVSDAHTYMEENINMGKIVLTLS